jgi:putative MATE family efflux protein
LKRLQRFKQRLLPLIRWEPDFTRLCLRMVIPIALQNLVSASLHIVDGVMVSSLGEQAYAGVVQTNRISFLVQLFLFGAVSGAGIFLAQFWGKGDVSAMRRVQGLMLRITGGIALVFTLAVALAPRQALGFFLPSGESFEHGLSYLLAVLPAYLITAADVVFATMLKASEQPRIPMIASIVSIGSNTLLNYGLIYGHFGLPALGTRGAAIATVIAAALSLCVNVGGSYLWRLAPAAHPREWRLPDRAFLARFFKTTVPVVFNEGLWALGITLYSVVHGRMGDATVAAIGIANTVDQLMFTVGWGFMNGAAVIVGRSIGAGQEDAAYLYAKRLLLAAVVIMLGMGGLLLGIRGHIVRLFNFSPQAQGLAAQVLFISAFFLSIRVFNAVNVVGVLRSGGDTVFSMLLDVGSLWLVGVPLAALVGIALHQPIAVVYLCSQAEECLKVLLGLPRFFSRKWIHNLTRQGV